VLRRSFRIGLLVGVLGGAIAAIVRALQGRSPQPAAVAPAAWTPLPDAEPVVVPPRPAAAPAAAPAPAAPAAPRPRPDVRLADLQEAPKPAPGKKAAAKPKPAPVAPWVEPVDGECPPTHPIKAKMTSGIYHVPGGFNYARTRPDRCYRDAAAAEADGLRPSKR
jgi:hypothetical protein